MHLSTSRLITTGVNKESAFIELFGYYCKRIFPPPGEIQGSPRISQPWSKSIPMPENIGVDILPFQHLIIKNFFAETQPLYMERPGWLLKSILHKYKLVKLCNSALKRIFSIGPKRGVRRAA